MGSRGTFGGPGDIEEDDLIYDNRKDEHYIAVAINEQGITLRRRDTEYYVPHAIFEEWYDAGRIKRNEAVSAERPEWVEK